MRRLFWTLLLVGCHHRPPLAQLQLNRVILYQNGIGYFERSGHVRDDRVELEFSRHEVDDVLKTLTVLDKQGAAVATVDVPPIAEKDERVRVGVQLSGHRAHDVAVNYAIPTPTWKAAYRVVVEDKSSLLQAWAVIDNASQEDWKDVNLTLATGAPMSYALDLHSPTYVSRPDASGKLVAPVITGVVGNEKANAAQTADADKDGIPDAQDKCPQEPETFNGYEDEDGCPDRGRVVVTDSSIEVLDMVYFTAKSDKVKPESAPILDAVAATLEGNPSITKIEIQGHAADNEGTDAQKLDLADRRASAVREYLVGRGVARKRLSPNGYGDTQPIDDRKTEEGRAKNRRVAFLILKRTEEVVEKQVYNRPVARIPTRTTTKPVEVAGAVRYELGAPVTVRRGSATMVSILDKAITAEDAYLWRPDPNAPGSDRHPFRVVRMVNSSGYTLQPGPVAIFARGTFVGDSLLEQLDLDATAWIPYALDSGTTVTSQANNDEKPLRLVSLHKGVLTVENADLRVTHYTIAAGRQPAARIYLRHPALPGWKADLPAGSIDQGEAYLVPVALTANKTVELAITERTPRRRTIELMESNASDLLVYVDALSDRQLGDKLKAAIALRKDMAELEQKRDAIGEQRDELSQRSFELRDSLRALDKVKGADELRKKLVVSLAETTQKADAIAKQQAALTEQLAAARAKLQDAIRDLELSEPKH